MTDDETGQVAAALREAVAGFTDRVRAEDASVDEVARSEWALLRALTEFRDAAMSPERPDVLGWVPPVDELSGDEDGAGGDKVMQVATWFFAVTDEGRVLERGGQRAALGESGLGHPESVADVVATLAESEIDWPDLDAYEEMGLSIESAHFYTQVLHPDDD